MPLDSLWNQIFWNQGTFGGGSTAGLARRTAAGLIYAALRKAAVTLGPGRTPSPAQIEDGLDELNRLLGSLNCDRLFIYSLDIGEFPLEAGKASYTIGQEPTMGIFADWDAPRPLAITEANVVSGDGSRGPVAIYTSQQWAARGTGTGGGVYALYNDRSYPFSTIWLAGPPAAGELELYTWHQVPAFVSETDAVLLPPGYEDALVLNLAVRLAPHFQRRVDPDVRADARESLMRLLSINAPQPILEMPAEFACGCGDSGSFVISGGGSAGGATTPGPPGPPGIQGPPGPAGTSITVLAPVASAAELPASGNPGELIITNDTGELWGWDAATARWEAR